MISFIYSQQNLLQSQSNLKSRKGAWHTRVSSACSSLRPSRLTSTAQWASTEHVKQTKCSLLFLTVWIDLNTGRKIMKERKGEQEFLPQEQRQHSDTGDIKARAQPRAVQHLLPERAEEPQNHWHTSNTNGHKLCHDRGRYQQSKQWRKTGTTKQLYCLTTNPMLHSSCHN